MLKDTNSQLLDEMRKSLIEESAKDLEMREKYKERWIRVESAKMNGNLMFQIDEFSKKSALAEETDRKIKSKFEEKKSDLQILNLSKDILEGKANELVP